MPIRLIKASKNLNVGLNTIVEYLHKKGIQVDVNPNVKIEDEHYDLLINEFVKDKNLKRQIELSREKLQKDEKKETVAIKGYEEKAKTEPEKTEKEEKIPEKESIKTEIPSELKPKFNVVGNVDLNNLGKKTAKKEDKKVTEEAAKETSEDSSKESKETLSVETHEKGQKVQEDEEVQEIIRTPSEEPQKKTAETETTVETETKIPESKAEKQPQNEQPDTTKAEDVIEGENEEKDGEEEDSDVFRLKTKSIESKIVVKGTIDLNAINEKTRPSRKSKAQRKKERIEREQNNKKLKDEKVKELKKESIDEQKKTKKEDSDEAGTRKKRKRIRKNKVNLDKPGAYNENASRRKKVTLKKPNKGEVSDEDVQKQVKETLARLTEKRGGKGGAKYRREKREAVSQKQQAEIAKRQRESSILQLTEFVTANDLANMMNIPVTDIISTCMSLGVMVAINQRLDAETINIVAEEYGFKTKYVSADVSQAIQEKEDNPEDLKARSPIVTVMGHVDHGKTSLLDSIRNTNVIAGEAGGITQHIGAYNVKLQDDRKITFLDTPGHEAFTAMRARGAKVTDVAIIIVAADDNVMPQTVEAINHASAAGVPIVFAINKIDKPGANPDKVKEELANMNYLVEDWGGKYQSQDISAKKGIGIQELLEKVLLEADMLELQANPNRNATGSVIESSLDKGRGYVATILVQNGTLKQSDIVLAGSFFGRVKAMFNERNQRIEETGPAKPALILGLNGAPQAGDTFHVMENESEARAIANKREQLQREQSIRTQKILTLDDIGRRIAIGNFQELNVIVKGDVDGSVEALSDSLIRLSTPEIQVNVIHKAVGQISESDITLAAASDAIIIGFQVRPSLAARKEAEKEGVEVRLYSVIYNAIEEVKAAMEGMLSPEIKEEITANIEIREVFKISKVGAIAGCMVKDGKVKRSSKVRLIRDGIVVYTGELDSLKRFKDDVKEVASGYECGLNIKNFNDIKVGDIVEAFEEVEIKKTL